MVPQVTGGTHRVVFARLRTISVPIVSPFRSQTAKSGVGGKVSVTELQIGILNLASITANLCIGRVGEPFGRAWVASRFG
jgi:hypothetical protein